jgi:hypothetical protein
MRLCLAIRTRFLPAIGPAKSIGDGETQIGVRRWTNFSNVACKHS